jgi:FKBP-type peptidyl-prolyl cis-trans isomerase FkpA
MKSFWKRAGWIFLTVLFIGTALGISVYAVWYDSNQKKADDTSQQANNNTQGGKKLKGTQLANFTPVPKIDSLQTIDQQVGTGDAAKADSTVTVNYTGALAATGVIFESSKDSGQPATFPINGVIKGWQQGIPGMKVGGIRRLLIPADLAYGSQGNSSIPPNSDLVFDVELLSVQ